VRDCDDAYRHTRSDAEHHVAHLADSVERQQAPQLVLDHRHHHGRYDGDGPYDHQQHLEAERQLEEPQRHACQQDYAEQLVQRGGQERHRRHGSMLGRRRNPRVQRHGAGLGQCSNQEQQVQASRAPSCHKCLARALEEVNAELAADDRRLGEREKAGDTEDERDVGESEYRERLRRPRPSLGAAEPHQQVQHQRHGFPRKQEDEQVASAEGHAGSRNGPERKRVELGPLLPGAPIRQRVQDDAESEQRRQEVQSPHERADAEPEGGGQAHWQFKAGGVVKRPRGMAPQNGRQDKRNQRAEDGQHASRLPGTNAQQVAQATAAHQQRQSKQE
jgi:hypothetical protein